ncbi:hypothetical protein [Pseudanabaena sp. 'Roaring Creek']|uniref:hypothetical protein n=1 Tax=Pseudanabaena sp. 'Roaring Creek' TaxID=1681830 RepID=UPI000A62D03A|nr:hypothetical protein [Pseudanabaena sp. 'Roaring Creek']
MNSSDNSVTACRLCQHYSPEGRRGGFCGKLDVPVSPSWEACSLAAHPFEPSWQSMNNFNALLHDSLHDSLHEKIEISCEEMTDLQNIQGQMHGQVHGQVHSQNIHERSLSLSDY